MEDVGIITDPLINEVLTNSKKCTVIVNPVGSVKSKPVDTPFRGSLPSCPLYNTGFILHCSDCPKTHDVDLAGLPFTEIYLPLFPCAGIKGMCQDPNLNKKFSYSDNLK